MRNTFVTVIFVLGFAPAFLCAQCPDRLSLGKRITMLKRSNVSVDKQLKELNGYIPSFERCTVRADTIFAYLAQRIGALYSIRGDHRNAVVWSLKSIHAQTDNPDTLARTDFMIRIYHYLQEYYDSLHMQKNKMDAIDSCISIALRSGRINDDVVYTVWQRVDYSNDVGDYQRCVDYSKIGESITKYSHISEDSVAYVSGFFNMHVNALTLMNQFDTAEAILQNKIEAYKSRNDERNCGVFYNQLAEINTQKQAYGKSLQFLGKSLKCNKAINYRLGVKQTLNNIGFLYLSRLKDPDKAKVYFNEALQCHNDLAENRVRDDIETLNIYDNIANVFAAKGSFDSAGVYFDKAFAQLKPGIDENTFLDFPADELIANSEMKYITGLIKDKGDAFWQQYIATKDSRHKSRAINTYRVADQVLARVRSEQLENMSGIAWRANARSLYENAIEACYFSGDIENAFYFFEKSRSALLNDQMNANRHSTKEEIRRQVQVKRRLASLKGQLTATAPASAAYSDLQKTLYNTMRENDLISLTVKQRDPLYYRNYIDTGLISLTLFKKNILGDDRSLMEIFYGDNAVYVLSISGKDNRLTKVDKHRYDELTTEYVRYISAPAVLNQHYGRFMELSNDLHTLLFEGSTVKESRLIISPDGQYFPFESLVVKDKAGVSHFLLYDHAVSYTYSAAYLAKDSAENKDGNVFMGMAPVEFASRMQLPGLPESDASLARIAALFGHGKDFINRDATKDNFLKNFYRYRILQLYTHASGNGSEEPEIYFADSSLKLSEIDPVFGSTTRLVVLSACETGNGTFYKGEGVFSFNRTFASIGIPSAMVNLWSVDNQAVYQLTELFHRYMASGLPLDVSLQKVKLAFIKNASRDRSMPYYWAATVIVGRTDALLPAPSSFSWLWPSIAAAVILAIALTYYYKKN